METYDVVAVGGGPSGMSAAIHLASEGRSVLLLEKENKVGGQAGTSSSIENLLPFSRGFSGQHFIEESCIQCGRFGVSVMCNHGVSSIARNLDGSFNIFTKIKPYQYQSRVVLLATGLRNKWLGLPGEGLPGVYHGMVVDPVGDMRDKWVVLVGGGNATGQAAEYYLGAGANVVIMARKPLVQTMSAYLLDRIRGRVAIEDYPIRSIDKFGANLRVNTGSPMYVGVDRVHILCGQAPDTDWLRGLVEVDKGGYIVTGLDHMTSTPGIFAAGDVVSDSVRRLGCAIGYGQEVVPFIHRYLDGVGDEPVRE